MSTPEECLTKKCSECEWHVLNPKLNCNLDDRLGIGKPKITSYLETKEENKEKEKDINATA